MLHQKFNTKAIYGDMEVNKMRKLLSSDTMFLYQISSPYTHTPNNLQVINYLIESMIPFIEENTFH